MSSENKQLAVLAPYALVSSILFSLLTAVLCWAGVYDFIKSTEQLPARTVYTLVMYGAFSVSMAIAAFSSFHAFISLRKLKKDSTENHFFAAVKSLVRFLTALFFWLGLILLAACLSVFATIN